MDGAEAARMIEISKRSSDIGSRRQAALKISRGRQTRGLLERLAQAEVASEMAECIQNHRNMRDIVRD